MRLYRKICAVYRNGGCEISNDALARQAQLSIGEVVIIFDYLATTIRGKASLRMLATRELELTFSTSSF
jgi:hypothetical protein